MARIPAFQAIEGLPQWRQAHLHSVGSTNSQLLEWSREADLDHCWLTAGEQTAGRGRRARAWVSPQGNLHASLLLVDPAPNDQLGMLPLVTGVAVRNAIAALVPDKVPVELKWPNDILLNGAKCCGILLENDWRQGRAHVVIGCGINIVAHPLDTPYPATHLKLADNTITAEAAFLALASAFSDALSLWNRGAGNRAIRDAWLAAARGIGQPLKVNLAETSLEGIFDGITESGQLRLTMKNGTQREISAGDVFFTNNEISKSDPVA